MEKTKEKSKEWKIIPVKFNRRTLKRLNIDYDYATTCGFLQTINMHQPFGDWHTKNDKYTFLAKVDLDLCSKMDLVELIGTILFAFERNFDNKPLMSFYSHNATTAIIQIHLAAP
jgi:hypothetical protein